MEQQQKTGSMRKWTIFYISLNYFENEEHRFCFHVEIEYVLHSTLNWEQNVKNYITVFLFGHRHCLLVSVWPIFSIFKWILAYSNTNFHFESCRDV